MGNLHRKVVSHCKGQWLSTRMRLWIFPRSLGFRPGGTKSAGFGRPGVQWSYYLPRLVNRPQKLTGPGGDVGLLPLPEGNFTSCACGERPYLATVAFHPVPHSSDPASISQSRWRVCERREFWCGMSRRCAVACVCSFSAGPLAAQRLGQTYTYRNSNRKMGVPATLSF